MSINITTAFVKQFTSGITMLAQQKGSRLRGAVRLEGGITGDRAFFDQIGATVMSSRASRHADTDYTDTPHSRRMVTLTPYDVADLVDKPDKIRTLNDPTNDYVRAFAAASGRTTDDVIIASAFAAANTGVDGASSTSFDTTNYQIAAGATGLTKAKLIEARKILKAAENDPDEGFNIAVSQEQIEDLLGDTTLTSADYLNVQMLVSGEPGTVLGFNFIQTERLGVDSASARRCIAWAKNSLLLGVGAEPRGEIDMLPTKRYSTQVFYSQDLGATRMDETGVVEVLCVE